MAGRPSDEAIRRTARVAVIALDRLAREDAERAAAETGEETAA